MKRILMAAIAASALLLAGCPATPEDVAWAKSATVSSFSNPELVGRLPDGRAVKRVIVVQAQRHDQFVYFVDNATVSTNYEEPAGKVTINQTRVSLSSNPTAAEVIAVAEDLKRQQDEAEEAEYQRLKAKRGQ